MVRALLIVGLLLVGVGVVGQYQGWWKVDAGRTVTGRPTVNATVNTGKMDSDRDAYVAEMNRKIAEMDAKIKDFNERKVQGEMAPKFEEAKRNLETKRKQLADRLDEAGKATAETWEDFKTRSKKAFDDLADGVKDAYDRFKN